MGNTDTPHISVLLNCSDCKHLQAAIISEHPNWGDFRNACRCCRTGNRGIYKADAIYDLYYMHIELMECNKKLAKMPPRNIGKKATRYKTHGKKVMELYSNGYSISAISRDLGLNWKTVKSIIQKLS